jgi:hypothetical protein
MGRYTLNRLGVDPYSYIILIRLLAGLYFAGYLLIAPGGIKTFVTHVPRHKGMLFWIAMLNTVNGTALAISLAAVHAVRVLAIVRLSAIITTVVGGNIFHEKNLVRKTFACGVMLAGALWVALG